MDDSIGLKLTTIKHDSEEYRALITDFLIKICKVESPPEDLIELVITAFTTPDYANDQTVVGNSIENSDRLEFCGDGVVKHIVCREVYKTYPSMTKGDMTYISEHLWSNRTYPECMYEAGINTAYLLRVGNSLKHQKGKAKADQIHTLISNSFEALVCALDLSGYGDAAEKLVLSVIRPEMKWAAAFLVKLDSHAVSDTFKPRGIELKDTFVKRLLEHNP